MPVFSYKATTIEGAIVEGVIEATDEKSAIDRLKNTGYIPLKIAAPREGVDCARDASGNAATAAAASEARWN